MEAGRGTLSFELGNLLIPGTPHAAGSKMKEMTKGLHTQQAKPDWGGSGTLQDRRIESYRKNSTQK